MYVHEKLNKANLNEKKNAQIRKKKVFNLN